MASCRHRHHDDEVDEVDDDDDDDHHLSPISRQPGQPSISLGAAGVPIGSLCGSQHGCHGVIGTHPIRWLEAPCRKVLGVGGVGR